MKKMRHIISVAILLTAFVQHAWSQENKTELFLYDPTFWGETLKLTPAQRSEIQEINSTFYSQVVSLEKTNEDYLQHLQDYVQQRSEQIYSTFRTRQKRKWDKIVEGFSAPAP